MATLTVSVQASTKKWIEEQIEFGGYADVNDFVNEVLRNAQEQGVEDTDALRRIVEDSRASGISSRTIDEIFADAVATTKARGLS